MALSKFSPVKPAAAYEVVVEHLRRALQLGRFLPGEKLPPERELAQQLEVSRTTLRQAIRVLEGEGLLESRRGAAGGLVVLQRSYSDRHMRGLVADRISEFEELYEFRLIIEVATARQAAAHRPPKIMQRIESALLTMEEITSNLEAFEAPSYVSRFLSADSHFHMGIAAASCNGYLERAVEDIRTNRFVPIGAVFPRLDPLTNDGHREMFEAIASGQVDRAGEVMRHHIEITRKGIREMIRANIGGRSKA